MSLTPLSDLELVASYSDLLVAECQNLVSQLDHLVEMDRRKLYFSYSTLKAYLVGEKGMDEPTAERRVRTARALKRFPGLRRLFELGKFNVSLLEIGLGCISREQLGFEEAMQLFRELAGLNCKQARRHIATCFPNTIELPGDRITPLDAEHSEVTFVADQRLLDKLEEIRGLIAHAHSGAKMADLIDVLVTEYRARHHPEEKARRAQARHQRKKAKRETTLKPTQMVTPASTREEGPTIETRDEGARFPSQPLVHKLVLRDGYLCSYVDPVTGKPCRSTFALEEHHRKSWASGGKTELSNLRWLCRGHHARVSFLEFGDSAQYAVPTDRGPS